VTGRLFVAGLAILLAAPALGQQDDSGADNLDGPASHRCSALADMDEARQTTMIYYLAGYYDGQRDATTIATVGQSAETAGETPTADGQEQPAEGATPSPTTGAVPELAMEAILSACAQSPDSRIVDIVTAHAGTTAP
jgi:hypothetical protein